MLGQRPTVIDDTGIENELGLAIRRECERASNSMYLRSPKSNDRASSLIAVVIEGIAGYNTPIPCCNKLWNKGVKELTSLSFLPFG